ncbi:UPF0462 protein C4orf33 [Trichonephila clavipes]|nr:UPF0462 protein C4orf33 [Trichonephila clavipes]
MCLPVEYQATINQQNNTWRGIASIPKTYFPPGVNRFNAYTIHGSGDGRQYEALFPVPTYHFTHPDFHGLEFFRYIAFDKLLAIFQKNGKMPYRMQLREASLTTGITDGRC